MARRAAIVLFAVAIAVTAAAQTSFDARLRQAHELLANGDVEGAMGAYRDLQTEDPENKTLYYSMGLAQYAAGEKEKELQAAEDALASYQEARASFEKAMAAADPELRKRASFNAANTMAQIALQSASAQKYDETLKAFEESVAEYTDFLKQYPEDPGARQNLDHMRFLLKKMQQNPPPPQEEQKGEQGEEKKEEEQEQKEEGEQEPQQGEQKQDAQSQDGQEKQEKPEGEQEQQQAQEQQGEQQEQQAAEEAEPPEDLDQENVEAILQSLQDADQREQKEERNQRRTIEMRTQDWW